MERGGIAVDLPSRVDGNNALVGTKRRLRERTTGGHRKRCAAAEAAEEQTEFDVVLEDAGSGKIAVIKAVKDLTNSSLGDAKAMVESAPAAVLTKVLCRPVKYVDVPLAAKAARVAGV